MKTLNDIDVREKRVLVRCDFDVSLDEQGNILEPLRIEKAVPTIQYLIKNEAKIILIGHIDRPGGQVVESLRMKPVQKKLSELLGLPIVIASDCIGPEVEKIVQEMKIGDVLLLENIRFHKEEEENDEGFARRLAKLGEIYINDAFANSHRKHASMVGLAKLLPAGAGFNLEKEIETLGKMMENPEKPLVVIVGGKKIETKARFINKISEIADFVLVSGLIKKEMEEKGTILSHMEKIIQPIDEDEGGKDIGPKTIELFKEKISKAKTIFWNGPFGKIEEERFAKGTEEIVKAIIESKAFSVVGGGETIEFINKMNLFSQFNYVSTGGGAMLTFLAGEEMPGIEALKWRPSASKHQVFAE
jgi:3-phosphoglycerate kinase